jgi:arylsulfatase A-like enzyme
MSAPGGRPFVAVSLGALVPAIVDVVSAQATVAFPDASVRAWHVVYDVGLFVALGLVVDLVTAGLHALTRRRPLAFYVGYAALGSLWAYDLLERNLGRQADVLLDGRFAGPILAAMTVGAGAAAPLCDAIGSWFAGRKWLFAVGPAAALGGAIANVRIYRDDYMEAHAAVAVCCAVLAGRALAVPLARWRAGASDPRRVRTWLTAAALLAAATAVVQPQNVVRLALFRSPGPAGAWLSAFHVWSLPEMPAGEPAIEARWLTAGRSGSRPPSEARIGGDAPVVVLVTVDAVRADAVLDETKSASFDTLNRLKREGAVFTNARSPGSQTSVSLTAVFTGKYFSETRWEKFGTGRTRFEYAAVDPTERFTERLTRAGVQTFKVVSLTFLRNEFGVAPGFAEEIVATEGRRHARAAEVIGPLADRLRKHGGEPMFAFAHMTEPHAPYDRKTVRGPAFERYLAEIEEADDYLERVVRALSSPALASRAILIVTSDHGEAFGEHGTYQHTKTIYDELLRVPLVVWGAGVVPRRIDTPVSLVDLGPTVLDIFGVDTPEDVTAESLVPLLAGQDARPTRPILAEGRLRRALVLGDTKVIVDGRRKTIEAFDLASDPAELTNLFDVAPERAASALATLEAFYGARTYRKDGYEPLYKP